MKSGSKRGAALAYVIVITAALMILAAALVSAAKFNIDYSQNSLEGRQAYLDAKSAIEYGKAYLESNPDSGDFTVVYSSKETDKAGFEIIVGTENTANMVAKYSATARTINATGKYKSSDRVRRLGYRMGTADSGDSSSSVSDFMALGSYGTTNIVPDYGSPLFSGQKVSSDYPVLFNRSVHLQSGGTSDVTVPSVYFLGIPWNGETAPVYNAGNAWSFYGDWGATMKLNTPFLYISNNFYSQPPSKSTDNTQLMVYGKNGENPCFVYFKNNCKIYSDSGSTLRATINSGLYKIKSGTNMFKINEIANDSNNKNTCLTKATDEEKKIYQKQIDYGNNIEDATKLFSGDSWVGKWGVEWTVNGVLKSGLSSIEPGGGGYRWTFNKICSGFKKIVYLYVTDCSGWGESRDIWRQNKAQYIAKEINLQYVNASDDFVIPKNKTVVFSADKISLNTQQSDTELSTTGTKPKITFDGVNTPGSYANFILQSADGTKQFDLTCPNDITVYYSDSQHQQQTYVIGKGTYHIVSAVGVSSGIGVNLFTYAAQTYFDGRKPDSPSGGSGSSGGGTEVTGGVYTDGQ